MRNESDLSPATRDAIGDIFHFYDPPLWLVTSADGDRRNGMIATSVTRASIVAEQPRILIAIANHHYTWGLIEATGRFAVHLLRRADLDAVWRFGLATGHRTDKFAGLPPVAETPAGNPLYRDAIAWLDCRVEQRMDSGDRDIYLAAITDGAILQRAEALTVATLSREAPPARREALDRLYTQDQATDRAAILAWRSARN